MSDFEEINRGYVTLDRKVLGNPIMKNANAFHLAMYCILKCTHKDYTAPIGDQFIELKAGQFVTGRKSISRDLNMSEQTTRTTIKKLKKLGFLTTKPTNRFSVVTVVKYNEYQQTNQQPTNSQPQTNTLNTVNKKKEISPKFVKPTIVELETYFLTKGISTGAVIIEAEKFFNFYESKNWMVGKNKMSKWKNAASGWITRSKKYENSTGNKSQSAATRTAENIKKEFG